MTDNEKSTTTNNNRYERVQDLPITMTLMTAPKLETERLTASKKQNNK